MIKKSDVDTLALMVGALADLKVNPKAYLDAEYGKRELHKNVLGLSGNERTQFANILWIVCTNNGQIKLTGDNDIEVIRTGVARLIDSVSKLIAKKDKGDSTDARISLLVERAIACDILSRTPDGQIILTGLVKWADNGYPQITLGHKYAAALLVSNISKDVLPMIKRPWSSFIIQVPHGLLTLYDNIEKKRTNIIEIMVSELHTIGTRKVMGPKWSYIAGTEGLITMWRYGVETEELLPPSLEGNPFEQDPLCLEITDEDERVSTLIGRLIINTCAAMTDKTTINEVGPGHRAYRERGEGRSGPPTTRTFQVGTPVKLDFREHIRKYLTEGSAARGPISVQSLVAGHFKSQPYGPHSNLRKVIYRQPYWRGPEDAPINVRPHIAK